MSPKKAQRLGATFVPRHNFLAQIFRHRIASSVHLFYICLVEGWYRCLGSRRCVGSPTAIFLHNFKQDIANILTTWYSIILWHVSTPNPRHITIKWVRESVITGALQVGLNYLFDI